MSQLKAAVAPIGGVCTFPLQRSKPEPVGWEAGSNLCVKMDVPMQDSHSVGRIARKASNWSAEVDARRQIYHNSHDQPS